MGFVDNVKQYFALGLGATAGYMLFMMCAALFFILFAGGGWMLLRKYNKKKPDGKQTPMFKEMTGMQYVGAVLLVIGLLPFLTYLIQGLLFSVGAEAGSGVFDSIMGDE